MFTFCGLNYLILIYLWALFDFIHRMARMTSAVEQVQRSLRLTALANTFVAINIFTESKILKIFSSLIMVWSIACNLIILFFIKSSHWEALVFGSLVLESIAAMVVSNIKTFEKK